MIMEPEHDEPTIDDLRVLVREIGKLWQMGDHTIVAQARNALLRVLRASGRKLLIQHKRRRDRAATK